MAKLPAKRLRAASLASVLALGLGQVVQINQTHEVIATFLQGATDQAAECDPDEGYFYNCINQDGSKYRPELAAGQQINEVCPGGNFACERCGSGTRIDNNACVDCEQGFYQDADFAVGNTCKSCTAGEYQDETGQTSCKPTSRGFYQNQIEKSFHCHVKRVSMLTL